VFTGIIETQGRVQGLEPLTDAIRLTIESPDVLDDARLGDSISVNGCCLTVSQTDGRTWTADVMAESLRRTTLGQLVPGDLVNLERAAQLASRLGGHLVQGHVDAVATVLTREPAEHWEVVSISLPTELNRYVVDKGSITVDGISLTVVEVSDEQFSVSLIPETLARTSLGRRTVGEQVNLEVDVLAKYVERLLAAQMEDKS
jgi:riboflavin synthase